MSRSAQAQDPLLAQRLWDVSIAMTGIDPGLPAGNQGRSGSARHHAAACAFSEAMSITKRYFTSALSMRS